MLDKERILSKISESEEDIFEKIEKKKIITREMKEKLKEMKGFRNVLVHHYADADDELVFENAQKRSRTKTKFLAEPETRGFRAFWHAENSAEFSCT